MPRNAQLAQLNIARAKAPLDSPAMAGFMAQLERINAAADAHPGFVWRLAGAAGDATDFRVAGAPDMLVNLSVWEDVDSFAAYVYRSVHVEPMRRRAEWFDPLDGPHTVLWWIDAGHRPTIAEGVERLEHLRAHGPTPHAFGVRDRFAPPAQPFASSSSR